MKKILLSLSIITVLASCSKSDIEYAATGEIGFIPITENMTKSMMSGPDFETSEEFNLWAYYKPVTAGALDLWLNNTTDPQTYIDENTFSHKEEGKWGGKANPYFWPKTGSLVFTGYYPCAIKDSVSYDIATQTMTFTNIQQSRVGDSGFTEDIMYFNLTPSYSQNTVAAEFKHALSWISVVLVKDSNTPDQATISVNKVEFTNILPSGDATVVGGTDINWTADGTAQTVNIIENGPIVIAKNNTIPQAYQPIFIPQTMSGDLVIEYEIKSPDGSKFTETKTITLSGMKDSNNKALTSWEEAKHYTYTITIGTSEILIAPTVATWDNIEIPVGV